MRKVSLLLIIFMLSILPCKANSPFEMKTDKLSQTSVFVYHIPDDDDNREEETSVQNSEETSQWITSDDVTADTSGKVVEEESDDAGEEDENTTDDEYALNDMYSDVLKGYAEYNEGEEETITFDDLDLTRNKITILQPAKVEQTKFTNLTNYSANSGQNNPYFKNNGMEYSITPYTNQRYKQIGKFKAGAVYGQEISYAELEQSSGVFSSYDLTDKFSIGTSYMKTVNTTNNDYNDNFYFSPSYKINQYFTLKESFSADISKERSKAAVYLSINPFGNKDQDRLLFEFGASQTNYNNGALPTRKFSFTTKIKL